MGIARSRPVQAVFGIFVLAMLGLALADREAAYMTLYFVGAILLLLGAAAGMGGGIGGGGFGRPAVGRADNPARAYRNHMDERAAWLSQNLVLLLAGALLIGLGFLLNIA